MQKKLIGLFLSGLCIAAMLAGCNKNHSESSETHNDTETEQNDISETPEIPKPTEEIKIIEYTTPDISNAVQIQLSDDQITVDGKAVGTDSDAAVYTANDIIFYLEGQDFTYGEGTEADEHSQAEADSHTVVHITEPGTYAVSGTLSAGQYVDGATGEGDGIDSNGWLVINGGSITASACSISGDAGIDSDMGIYINGGSVTASGNMLDHISGGNQTYAVFNFASTISGRSTITLKDDSDTVVMTTTPENDFTYLILAGDDLKEGTYTLWNGDTQLSGAATGSMMSGRGMGGGQMQGGMGMPQDGEVPEGMEEPQDGERPQMPQNGKMPGGMELPEGMELPDNGQRPDRGQNGNYSVDSNTLTTEFALVAGGNMFSGVTAAS